MARTKGLTFLVWSPIERIGVEAGAGWSQMYLPDDFYFFVS
jgi:hypothetical protein